MSPMIPGKKAIKNSYTFLPTTKITIVIGISAIPAAKVKINKNV